MNEYAAVALTANCPLGDCWKSPGIPCTPHGQHLARYQRAYRRGALSRDGLAAVVGTLDIIAGRAVVPDGAVIGVAA